MLHELAGGVVIAREYSLGNSELFSLIPFIALNKLYVSIHSIIKFDHPG